MLTRACSRGDTLRGFGTRTIGLLEVGRVYPAACGYPTLANEGGDGVVAESGTDFQSHSWDRANGSGMDLAGLGAGAKQPRQGARTHPAGLQQHVVWSRWFGLGRGQQKPFVRFRQCNVLHTDMKRASTLRLRGEVHALEEGLEAGIGNDEDHAPI